MFDLNKFITQCQTLNQCDDAQKRINDHLKAILRNSDQVTKTLGKPTTGGIDLLYHSTTLTIINFVMTPGMELHAHNHNMWAVIGIYTGVEENSFYTRKDNTIEKKNQKNIVKGNTIMLGKDIIHSVKNPDNEFSGGIHIYGGDFIGQERSQWDMGSLTESPYDIELTKKIFEDSNKIYTDSQ